MAAGILDNQRKRRAGQRVVSLLLLLLCFSDLAIADVFFPGSCEGDSEMPLVRAQSSTTTELHQGISSLALQQESQPAPAESTPVEEDCFCCCTHIVPVAFYKFARPLLQTEPIASYPLSVPTAPHTKLFHPPRLA